MTDESIPKSKSNDSAEVMRRGVQDGRKSMRGQAAFVRTVLGVASNCAVLLILFRSRAPFVFLTVLPCFILPYVPAQPPSIILITAIHSFD